MNLSLINKVLERDEGRRNKVYLDSKGIETVGVGRNLRDKGLSNKEIDFLLQNDIDEAVANLMTIFPYFSDFSDARQAALISLMFAGLGTFLGFRKMIAAIKDGNWREAGAQVLDSLYAKQVGDRAHRIAKALEEG